jgi:hypothetical protein
MSDDPNAPASEPESDTPPEEQKPEVTTLRVTGLPFQDSFTSSDGITIDRLGTEVPVDEVAKLIGEAAALGVRLEEVTS